MADPIPPVPAPGESGSERPGADEPPRKGRRKRPFWQELPILIGIALVLTILIQQFVAKVFLIPSASMETTLHGCDGCFGDRVVVDRVTYDFTDPAPGDVIVFRGPQPWTANEIAPQEPGNFFTKTLRGLGSLVGFAPPDERDFVKRVIAVGGQTVQCCDPQGRVLVDGKPLDEPYVHWLDQPPTVRQAFPPVTVPKGSLWVMGDNRENSCDSRCQGGGGVNGTVPVDDVIGKARVIVLPPSRWGGVSDHDPQAAPTALGAPAWQRGIPLGAGALLAFPALAAGRGVRRKLSNRD
ncbi:signal peptidase I [Amycolatopsis rubida]|uniref:Signal peptidase I n=1 Tax=Amycolatopsis rubida TaxID=112413 RepID=A0ABX0BY88_9PSEU|nr:signal peptidase I [Amycolatopsis sp. M39]MYW93260.1 signal peptidase I [Amycolatopsis rubida]NEC58247.1 signal peptidase I [Amycolatopsis rubida]OAP20124.1 Signal peptidase I [Amycolatopsis sp. M39]